ncbi:MAG: hypothetical protein QXM80_02950 [Thermofilaceae archaeon]
MGVFEVKARVWNVIDSSGRVDVELVVDSGFTFTVLPAKLLGSLSVEPVRRGKLRLADGRVVEGGG